MKGMSFQIQIMKGIRILSTMAQGFFHCQKVSNCKGVEFLVYIYIVYFNIPQKNKSKGLDQNCLQALLSEILITSVHP